MGFWLAGNPADFYIFLPLSNKLKIVKEEKEKREAEKLVSDVMKRLSKHWSNQYNIYL